MLTHVLGKESGQPIGWRWEPAGDSQDDAAVRIPRWLRLES